jgi:hypothetical protein
MGLVGPGHVSEDGDIAVLPLGAEVASHPAVTEEDLYR